MKLKNKYCLYVWLFWVIILVPIIFLITIFTLISLNKMGFMPSFEELENPKNNLASEVYSEDNKLLGNIFFENRSYINFEDLSPNMIDAVIASEDIRFSKHSGIDAKGLARVIIKTVILGQRSAGGGSTITQQLAKNLFPRDTTTYKNLISRKSHLAITKFKEWVIAIKLERNYTKEEIIVMYLNTVPFGSQSFGIKAATNTFFNKTPDELTIEEAALLTGMVKAPTRYSPVRNPERALWKRNQVLNKMRRNNYITQIQYDSISAIPIQLNYKVQNHLQGIAKYLREYLRIFLSSKKPNIKKYWNYKTYEEDSIEWETNPLYGWCNKNFKPDSTNYNIYTDGLRIYTTINSVMQRYAEEALIEHLSKDLQIAFNEEQKHEENAPFSADLEKEDVENIMLLSMKRTERYRILRNSGLSLDSIKSVFNKPVSMTVFSWSGEIDTTMSPLDSIRYYKHFLHSGFLSMDPHTGFVKTYVGGIDYKHFKYDHIKKSKRQVGSTFKPFLYTLAMQEGLSPCYRVPNVQTTFLLPTGEIWTAKNSSNEKYDRKMVTLKWGLANSVNNVSTWLMKQFKPHAVINLVELMGIKSPILPVPSICLGSPDISLYEMVGAYSTFGNKGVYIEPVFVTRIEDKNGNILATFTPKKTEAFSERTAYLMLNLLEGVVKHGTSIRLIIKYELTNQIAAKTGTTDNHSDGWFIGITPNLVSGVWVGGEERSIHFNTITLGQGANMALPIWALFMQKVYDDKSLGISKDDIFEKPLQNLTIEIDCEKYEQNDDELNEEVEYSDEDEFF
ncbi:MAG: penicillin-binding protein [Bacteroidales bacterium]|nr:penicillin-binding protein [Bacteroidales bacterium]